MTDDKGDSKKSSQRKSGAGKKPTSSGGRRIATEEVVDQYGAPVSVPEDKTAANATDAEQTVGATGPTNWWRIGIIVLVVLVAILVILQLTTGGSLSPTEPPPAN